MYDKPIHYFLISEKGDYKNKLTIKKSWNVKIFDEDFVFSVIGESHYIEADNFYEVFSVVDFKNSLKVDFLEDKNQKLKFETKNFFIDVEIKIYDFDKSVNLCKEFFNLFFDFNQEIEEETFTGIDIDENGWKTIHTYKEFGKIVFTRTILRKK